MPCLSGRESDPLRALESERRLLYVALTRAQKHLFITLPDPSSDSSSGGVSRFFAEMCIDASCAVGRALESGAERVVLRAAGTEVLTSYLAAIDSPLVIEAPELSAITSALEWSTGQRVRHSILGSGKILAQEEHRLHIRFNDGKVRVFASDVAAPHLTLEEI